MLNCSLEFQIRNTCKKLATAMGVYRSFRDSYIHSSLASIHNIMILVPAQLINLSHHTLLSHTNLTTHLLDSSVLGDTLAKCCYCLDRYPIHMTSLVGRSDIPLQQSDLLCPQMFLEDKETDDQPLCHLDSNSLHNRTMWHRLALPEDRSNLLCMEYSLAGGPHSNLDCMYRVGMELV